MEVITEPTTTVLVLASRKPGMSFEDFRAYYEKKHVPLIHRLLMQGDLRPLSYTRYYTERDAGDGEGTSRPAASCFPFGGADSWTYDCVTTLSFRDIQHRDAMFTVFAQHRDELNADNVNFLDLDSIKIIYPGPAPSSVMAKGVVV